MDGWVGGLGFQGVVGIRSHAGICSVNGKKCQWNTRKDPGNKKLMTHHFWAGGDDLVLGGVGPKLTNVGMHACTVTLMCCTQFAKPEQAVYCPTPT